MDHAGELIDFPDSKNEADTQELLAWACDLRSRIARAVFRLPWSEIRDRTDLVALAHEVEDFTDTCRMLRWSARLDQGAT